MNMQKLVRNERIIPPDLLSRVESSNLPLDDIEIDALHLSTRSYNALKRRGIDDIRKLVCLTDFDLAKIPNVGARSLQEIVRNTNEYLERIAEPEEAALLHKSQFPTTFGATIISAPKVGIRAFGVIGSLTSLVQNIGSKPNS